MPKKKKKTKKKRLRQPTWTPRIITLEGGEYRLGPQQKYSLSEKALVHIVNGEFSERQIRELGQKTKTELVLKGGLHTYQAWIDFKNRRGDIVHLLHFNSNSHKHWYFARRLQNGVTTLRIPREFFQAKAANITKFPDFYYKSGYLWKTLFPPDKASDDILCLIDEALHNLNREECKSGLLIGYAQLGHPFTAMKVRIQATGDQINSAFPTWEQPMTGNTGQAYSHSDTISFLFAQSTEFFDDETIDHQLSRSKIYDHDRGISSVVANTPQFLLARLPLQDGGEINNWNLIRGKELSAVALKFSHSDVLSLQAYLEDSFVCKGGYWIQQGAYHEKMDELLEDRHLFNSISIHQNIIESLTVVHEYDQSHKSNHFVKSMSHMLMNKIGFTGGLDSWNNKRLHNRILNCVISYHDPRIISVYLRSISECPIRNSLYTEFDISNLCIKRNFDLSDEHESGLMALVNLPTDNYPMLLEYFRNYLLLLINDNYFINFDRGEIEKFIDNLICQSGVNEQMIIDSVCMTETTEFCYFQSLFRELVKIILAESVSVESSGLSSIVRDVFRIQTAQRMKILLRNPDFDLDAIEYLEFGSNEFKNQTATKHERQVNVLMLEQFLNDSLKLADHLNDTKLCKDISQYKSSVWTERPPMQKFIPDYIVHWMNQKDQSWKNDLRIIGMRAPRLSSCPENGSLISDI